MPVEFNIALRNLFQAKRRTFLLGAAVALVALLFLVLRSVSHSVAERMIESATTLSAGHVNVAGFTKTKRKSAGPLLGERRKLLAFVKAHVPEAKAIIDRHRGWGRLVSPASSMNTGVNGIEPAQEQRFFASVRLAAEKEYKKDGTDAVKGRFEDLNQPNSVLIFAGQAKKLEVGPGDMLTLVTEGGVSNSVDLRVAAVASDLGFMSNWSIFVPRQTILDLYRLNDDTTGAVMIYLDDPADALPLMERLRKEFKDAKYEVMDHDPKPFFAKFEKVAGEDWLGQHLDLTIWSDEVSFVLWITAALDAVSFFVVGILALIIVGGITNAMWMSVRERTKEIGTMRAIGAQKGFIVRVFLLEAIFLGFFAALAGTVVGGVLLAILNSLHLPISNEGARLFLMANTLKVNVHPAQIIATLALFSVITGLAALYPAIKASRLRPVEALMQSK